MSGSVSRRRQVAVVLLVARLSTTNETSTDSRSEALQSKTFRPRDISRTSYGMMFCGTTPRLVQLQANIQTLFLVVVQWGFSNTLLLSYAFSILSVARCHTYSSSLLCCSYRQHACGYLESNSVWHKSTDTAGRTWVLSVQESRPYP